MCHKFVTMSGDIMTDLDKKQVLKTMETLLKLQGQEQAGKKNLLSDGVSNVVLQFTFKVAPQSQHTIKMKLPHSLYREDQQVCLFVKDVDRKSREHEITEQHYKDLLSAKGVENIEKILPLKALKLEYKPFEAKIGLSKAYDLFLADECIVSYLPPLLGKHFYGKKKIPVPVNLKAKDLKAEIDKAVNLGHCVISGRGNNSSAKVGHSEMTAEQLAENVMTAVETLSKQMPGGGANFKSVFVKSEYTTSLPLFVSFEKGHDVILPRPEQVMPKPIIEEIDTLEDAKVKVYLTGEVKVINKQQNRKRRQINPDSSDDEEEEEEENEEGEEEEEKAVQMKEEKVSSEDDDSMLMEGLPRPQIKQKGLRSKQRRPKSSKPKVKKLNKKLKS